MLYTIYCTLVDVNSTVEGGGCGQLTYPVVGDPAVQPLAH